jgi:hypothetical protein
MDAENLRRCVWEEMLSAIMRSNYFAELVRHYLILDKGLRVATLVASSCAVVSALPQAPTEVRIIAPIIATAISFWLLVSQYGTMSRDASELHSGWSAIAHDYERLWNNLDSAGAEAEFHKIYESAEGLSKSGTKFPNKKRRTSYWLDEAVKTASARYA